MPALKKVKVHNCGLYSLFRCSIFRNLQKLDLSKCALLEGIVEDIRGDEHAGRNRKTITLLQLDYVVFKDLPNLKSLSTAQVMSVGRHCLGWKGRCNF